MSRTIGSKGVKASKSSQAVRTAAPIRTAQAQKRFVATAKKLGASNRVIKAAQRG